MIPKLNPHGEALLQQYREQVPALEQLSKTVCDQLRQVLREQAVELSAIECRVKTEASLAGKLERKGDKYASLENITDLVGLRIITFYTDDVDKVAAIVQQLYDVDWDNSIDKRKAHELTSFGYNSLHYICRLKEGSAPFEIQMRTALQHVWSAIEHDIGYKGAVKLPPEYRRQFSRLAGMLELADDEFSRLRTTMTDYRRHVQALVKSGKLDEVALSTDSFSSYLQMHPFNKLNQRIAAVNQAEIFPASLLPYMSILEGFGLETLGDLQRFIDSNSDDAYQLAVSQLAITDLDILSESIGLQNLCIVHILKTGGGRVGLKLFYDTIYGTQNSNEMLADMLYEQVAALPFVKK
jgi:ppGpp synthetase/RelA/SpoT-type nucleotidyltranferase